MAGEDEKETLDAPADDVSLPVESVEKDVKEEDAGDEDENEAVGEGDEMEVDGRPVSNPQYKALKNIADILTNYKIKKKLKGFEDEYFPSSLFRRLPNKNRLPDYYQVISEPSALSTLKGKIQRKQYTGIPEYVRDFALIVHNAQVYNRPNSAPVRDVLRLEAVFKEEMQKLVDQNLVAADEITFPDLGPIPDATPEPDPVNEDEEDIEDDADDDEDDEDEADDSDDDRRKKRGRRGRPSMGGRRQDRDDDDDNDRKDDAEQKRRGRPPKVDTPMEARIKAVLKGVRKVRNDSGHFMYPDFEKLPDKAEHPSYYLAIKTPIALDVIRKKAKRKKYNSVDDFMHDVRMMFDNAMAYNEDGSVINENAKALLAEAESLAAAEKAKPDSEYLMQEGRLPLPFIDYNGKMWRVGDWIHIRNPNDVTKPIVAQIYRTWQDGNEQKWINACWYYRPEQTVHQYEKHFFPNEVVKTGQYRDHPIEEVVDKCFVMFFTRYSRGRPRGIDPAQEVYVCEARYNEEKFKFNKIKTWASCLPDEVRDKDYEMDLYDVPKRVKKLPSPLLHLLKDDVQADDPLPQPQWANPNAPPVVGAVHKRPRDDNQSPPPEPTPPPPPTPPPVARPPSAHLIPQQARRPSLDRQASSATPQVPPLNRPSTSMTPQSTFTPTTPATHTQYQRQAYTQPSANQAYVPAQPQTPGAGQPMPYATQQQLHNPPSVAATQPPYSAATPAQPYGRAAPPVYQAQQPYPQAYPAPSYDIRQREVYILSDTANETIPQEIRDRYPQDEQGHILFFTKPPMETQHVTTGRADSEQGIPLQHTDKYLKAQALKEELRDKRSQERNQDQQALLMTDSCGGRRKSEGQDEPQDVPDTQAAVKHGLHVGSEVANGLKAALTRLVKTQQASIAKTYQANFNDLEDWRGLMDADQEYARVQRSLHRQKHPDLQRRRSPASDHELSRTERYKRRKLHQKDPGPMKEFWTGLYHDDVDPRLPF